MKRKNSLIVKCFLVISVLITLSNLYKHYHYSQYSVKCIVVDKLTTQNRDGNKIYYHLILRYKNTRNIEEIECSPATYVNYNKGDIYYRLIQEYHWE